MTARARWLMLVVTSALIALSAVIWLRGGFETRVGPIHLSSRDPFRPLEAAVIIGAIAIASTGLAATRRWLSRSTGRLSPPLVIVLALALAVAGFCARSGSRVAEGPDMYGYISQAQLWRAGRLMTPVPLASQVPWPNALATFTPLGYRAALTPDGLVPTYAPGLPLLMAAAAFIGGTRAMFWIVPLSAGLLVFMTFHIGRLARSSNTGVLAATFVAISPAFLFGSVWPMSDVPASACWAVALWGVLRGGLGPAAIAGFGSAIAIMIRPNLAPIALAMLAAVLADDHIHHRPKAARALLFGGLTAIGCLFIAGLNNRLYGSPFRSGYGATGDLFAWSYIPGNIWRYASWLTQTQTPIAIAGLGVVATGWRALSWSAGRQIAWRIAAAGTVAAVLAIYCCYLQFDDWGFLRFLLPLWPIMMIGTAALLLGCVATRDRAAWPLFVVATTMLVVFSLVMSDRHGVLGVRPDEDAKRDAVVHAGTLTTNRDVIFALQHAGTLRYYTGRTAVRFDALDPAWLDRAMAWVAQQGGHSYLLVENWEKDQFAGRFAGTSRAGSLQGAPVFVEGGVSFYALDSK